MVRAKDIKYSERLIRDELKACQDIRARDLDLADDYNDPRSRMYSGLTIGSKIILHGQQRLNSGW